MAGVFESQLPPGGDAIVKDLADIRREMAEQIASVARSFQTTVAELEAAQTELAAAQTELAAAQADILELVASQVAVDGKQGMTTGISVNGAHTVKRQVTLTVPAWAERAVVIAIGTVNVIGPNLRALRLSVEADVSGSPIIYGPQAIEGASMGAYAGTVGHVAVLEAPFLASITCAVLASREYGDLGYPAYGTALDSFAHLSAVALFTR